MKVKVIKPYRDSTADLELRKLGQQLTYTKTIGNKLIKLGFVKEVKEVAKNDTKRTD